MEKLKNQCHEIFSYFFLLSSPPIITKRQLMSHMLAVLITTPPDILDTERHVNLLLLINIVHKLLKIIKLLIFSLCTGNFRSSATTTEFSKLNLSRREGEDWRQVLINDFFEGFSKNGPKILLSSSFIVEQSFFGVESGMIL